MKNTTKKKKSNASALQSKYILQICKIDSFFVSRQKWNHNRRRYTRKTGKEMNGEEYME
jgi:hypothetical protein